MVNPLCVCYVACILLCQDANRADLQYRTNIEWIYSRVHYSIHTCRPGPKLIFKFAHYYSSIIYPIIQEKVLKKADKIQMKHEYDQNVHIHLGPQVLDYM